jgi:hypothetical protein
VFTPTFPVVPILSHEEDGLLHPMMILWLLLPTYMVISLDEDPGRTEPFDKDNSIIPRIEEDAIYVKCIKKLCIIRFFHFSSSLVHELWRLTDQIQSNRSHL